MKKILIITFLGLSLLITGCGFKKDEIKSTPQESNTFVATGDKLSLNGAEYEVVYDKYSKIVYLSCNTVGNLQTSVASLCPYIGKDKLPITLAEYKVYRKENE